MESSFNGAGGGGLNYRLRKVSANLSSAEAQTPSISLRKSARVRPILYNPKQKNTLKGCFSFGAGDRTRTGTVARRILSAVRLPIPPHRRDASLSYHIPPDFAIPIFSLMKILSTAF